MEKRIPDNAMEEQELLPGGDLRIRANHWLREAWDEADIERVPREAEVRKVVQQIVHRNQQLCPLALS